MTERSSVRDEAQLTYVEPYQHTVRFVACPGTGGADSPTQFAGGFAIRGTLCLPLDITWTDRTERITLAFGTHGC